MVMDPRSRRLLWRSRQRRITLAHCGSAGGCDDHVEEETIVELETFWRSQEGRDHDGTSGSDDHGGARDSYIEELVEEETIVRPVEIMTTVELKTPMEERWEGSPRWNQQSG